jgi:DNA-binding SARP family transcriptional activator
MAHLSVCLLRPFRVGLDFEAIAGFASDTARAWLVYLAVEAVRPDQRQSLAGLLWPEFPQQPARKSLSSARANARAIGDRPADPPFLHVSWQMILFDAASNSWIDVAELIARLETREGSQSAAVGRALVAPENGFHSDRQRRDGWCHKGPGEKPGIPA